MCSGFIERAGFLYYLPSNEGEEFGEKECFIFQHNDPLTVIHLFQRFSNKAAT
jgi:hypothetical protein